MKLHTNNHGLSELTAMLESSGWYEGSAKHWRRSGAILDKIDDAYNWEGEEKVIDMKPSNHAAPVALEVDDKEEATIRLCMQWFIKKSNMPNSRTVRNLVRQVCREGEED